MSCNSIIGSELVANGPAIKGGCVTRPAGQFWTFRTWGRDINSRREGMARVFAVRAQVIWDIRVSWVQSSQKVAKLSWCFSTVLAAKRSVAVGIVSEPEICHGCRSLIVSSARIRVQLSFLICLGSRNLFAKTVTS